MCKCSNVTNVKYDCHGRSPRKDVSSQIKLFTAYIELDILAIVTIWLQIL